MSEYPKEVAAEHREELVNLFGFRADRDVMLLDSLGITLEELFAAFEATLKQEIITFEMYCRKAPEWKLTVIPEGLRAVEGAVSSLLRKGIWNPVDACWEIRGYGFLTSDKLDDTPFKGDVVIQTGPMRYSEPTHASHVDSEFVAQFLDSKPVSVMRYIAPGVSA